MKSKQQLIQCILNIFNFLILKFLYYSFTFIPFSIFHRMKSFLNIFFLLNTILSSIKIFSTKSPASTLSPFLIVISIGLVLDGIEEIKRYRNDLKTNNTKVKV